MKFQIISASHEMKSSRIFEKKKDCACEKLQLHSNEAIVAFMIHKTDEGVELFKKVSSFMHEACCSSTMREMSSPCITKFFCKKSKQ